MSYAQLQEDIADWLMRQDLEPQIPTFIRMGESRINRLLRHRRMIKRSRVISVDRFITLPTDWRKAWNIERISDAKPIVYLTPGELDKYRRQVANHEVVANDGPEHYTLLGDTMELVPAPMEDDPVELEMIYYAAVPSLSSTRPTNWLLEMHPEVHLYAALIHTAPYLKDDTRIAVWNSEFATAIRELNAEQADARRSGSPMTIPKRSF